MDISPHKRLRIASPSREPQAQSQSESRSQTVRMESLSKPLRSRGPKNDQQSSSTQGDLEAVSSSPFVPIFQTFRSELDVHHDRRERVIKASRDITALSKKMIFTLQRTPTLGTSLPAWIINDLSTKEKTIAALLRSVYPSDLSGINAWRYQRQISSGLQEYMEAAVFRHYLQTGRLLSYEEAQALIEGLASNPDADANNTSSATVTEEIMLLTYEDYILGIFDAVGEMMRWGITNLALTRGTTSDSQSQSLIQDLRLLRLSLESLKTHGSGSDWSIGKKMDVMRTCVEKVEGAVYGMVVRGRERPEGWVPSGVAASGPTDIAGDRRAADEVEGY